MLTVYLARHAATTWNEENRIQGSHNPELSAGGKKQAERLAKRLKKEGISLIYASDLLRARQTARIIQKRLKVPIRYERKLREIHLGEWEGKTPEEVNREYRNGYARWRRTPSRVRIPGAESVSQFRRRVFQAFKRLLRSTPEGRLLVVTHGGVIATFLSSLLRGSEDYFLVRLSLDNAGFSVVQVNKRRIAVVSRVNDTSHLDGLRNPGA